jgi:hypothetical protein
VCGGHAVVYGVKEFGGDRCEETDEDGE